ncbi:MAG: thioesterase [Deltaproteobacteria bacterium]|nr:MAG: thioesterase [Desulfobacterales bacterium]PIE72217.1 MAG: thioesterase [Deltaproteobacteria bacterium]
MCFVCGLENSFGLKSKFYELENGQLMAVFSPLQEHQGYPGRLHGGIAATILDETIGRAIMATDSEDLWGVTIDFSMKFRKPIPLDEEVRVFGWVTAEKPRYFTAEGKILLSDGTVAATAEGKYLKMAVDNITESGGADAVGWQVYSDREDPEYIDI